MNSDQSESPWKELALQALTALKNHVTMTADLLRKFKAIEGTTKEIRQMVADSSQEASRAEMPEFPIEALEQYEAAKKAERTRRTGRTGAPAESPYDDADGSLSL